ncbi:hypothetical protein KW797_04440, partial [Candidatus Parcubacteria bacterium]|nr:hypothetical protein [Candidatus Parcubacteria bacterium]
MDRQIREIEAKRLADEVCAKAAVLTSFTSYGVLLDEEQLSVRFSGGTREHFAEKSYWNLSFPL